MHVRSKSPALSHIVSNQGLAKQSAEGVMLDLFLSEFDLVGILHWIR